MKIQYVIILLLFSLNACSQTAGNAYENIDNKTFAEKMKGKDVVVLDVRTPEEFKEGHIPGAELFNFMDPDFASGVEALDKNKTYLVYCAAGGRSAKAATLMSSKGFKNIYNLPGGFSSWDGAKEK